MPARAAGVSGALPEGMGQMAFFFVAGLRTEIKHKGVAHRAAAAVLATEQEGRVPIVE